MTAFHLGPFLSKIGIQNERSFQRNQRILIPWLLLGPPNPKHEGNSLLLFNQQSTTSATKAIITTSNTLNTAMSVSSLLFHGWGISWGRFVVPIVVQVVLVCPVCFFGELRVLTSFRRWVNDLKNTVQFSTTKIPKNPIKSHEIPEKFPRIKIGKIFTLDMNCRSKQCGSRFLFFCSYIFGGAKKKNN